MAENRSEEEATWKNSNHIDGNRQKYDLKFRKKIKLVNKNCQNDPQESWGAESGGGGANWPLGWFAASSDAGR